MVLEEPYSLCKYFILKIWDIITKDFLSWEAPSSIAFKKLVLDHSWF